jgi:hypothetical protein
VRKEGPIMRGRTVSPTDMMIVPCPHRGQDWCLVNRRGDLLAAGDYAYCSRRLRLLATVAA